MARRSDPERIFEAWRIATRNRLTDSGIRDLVPRFILGAATGLLFSLLISLSPFLVVVVAVAILIATVVSVVKEANWSRSMYLAGSLVGAGTLFLYGSINTFAACVDTDDFCGDANVLPLTLLALVTIGAGAIAAVIVAVRESRVTS